MSDTSSANPFLQTLTSEDPGKFDCPVEQLAAGRTLDELLEDCAGLDSFWPGSDNLYLRVRALIFLYWLHRFALPERIARGERAAADPDGELLAPQPIPMEALRDVQQRNFSHAIVRLLQLGLAARLNETLSSGLADAYHAEAMQSLANQVRRSVRAEIGNQWMFRIGHPDDHPLRVRSELIGAAGQAVAWLIEETPVRMDLSHSCWSDIFFLGMDRPEFAKVINASVDLTISGRGRQPVPPCLSAFRVIDRPVIRLVSLDLEVATEVTDLAGLFDFGRDYLGLLKAAIIASGLVPPGMEGSSTPLPRLLRRMVGAGRGIELVSWVRDIPKGSRLAVSTNLLGGMISVCMRASGQVRSLRGELEEDERRMVASRAILGEWLGGSGGGWQDSGGVWPGIKLIEGCHADGAIAAPMAPSRGRVVERISNGIAAARGALLPRHTRLDGETVAQASVTALEDSLVLIHGGMAANVGPILDMVTERYLLRGEREWQARHASLQCTAEILEALSSGDIRRMGALTTEHFYGPLRTVIPWASNAFTERLIEEVGAVLQREFGTGAAPDGVLNEIFWGFWMLGGMSGGGMGLIVHPRYRDAAKPLIAEVLQRLKREYQHSLPFAMDPVIYDFRLNVHGSVAHFGGTGGSMERFHLEYHRFQLPLLLRKSPSERNQTERIDLARIREHGDGHASELMDALLPPAVDSEAAHKDNDVDAMLQRYGFDQRQHEQIRADLLADRIGLRHNRLHPKTVVEDVSAAELANAFSGSEADAAIGMEALRSGSCAVITMAAGAGSRWTQGAGVVKALHPFAPLAGRFRRFLEVHVAKSARSAALAGTAVPHVITTSYLTHQPIASWLETFTAAADARQSAVDIRLSEGRSVGLRLTPTLRDLRYAWYETPGERLDEQAEKMRESVRTALMGWASASGEASDYRDNLPLQCMHPVGHWYELPNMFLNGVLAGLLSDYPDLRYLLLHNIDTLGADLDPALLGRHILSGAPLSYEVIQRRFEDVGGGLARINGQLRLVEGFALPREEDEFKLSFYNTLTTWIDIDELLRVFGLSRSDFVVTGDPALEARRQEKIRERVRRTAASLPTYMTLKETKKRWGRGQEDIFPVLQFERLWGDMSAVFGYLSGDPVAFFHVPRARGRQLKDPAQLDGWMREGALEALQQLWQQ